MKKIIKNNDKIKKKGEGEVRWAIGLKKSL